MEEYNDDNGETSLISNQALLSRGSKKQQRKARDPGSEDYMTNQMATCLQHLEDLKNGQEHIWHALSSLVDQSNFHSNLHPSVQEAPIVDSPGIPDTLATTSSAKTKVQAPLPIPASPRPAGKAKRRIVGSIISPIPSEKTISDLHLAESSTIKDTWHSPQSQLKENKEASVNAQGGALDSKNKRDESKLEEHCERSKQILVDAMWDTWKKTREPRRTLEAEEFIDQWNRPDEINTRPDPHVGRSHMMVPLTPTSALRVAWDMLSIFVIGYDLIVLPFAVSFDLSESSLMKSISVVITIYWTLDVFLMLATGYYYKGGLEMKAYLVFARYFRTWLLIDVVILTVDYLTLFLLQGSNNANYAAVARIPKLARVFRILRLLRLLRFNRDRTNIGQAFLQYCDDYAEELIAGWAIWRLVLIILFINHFLACAWHGIAKASKGTPSSWVEEIKGGSYWWYYTSAFHWAVAQFCPAAIEIHPENTSERVFALFTVVFGLVGFSSFTSSLTTEFSQWRKIRRENNEQTELLERYIKRHRMPVETGTRLQYALRKELLDVQRDTRVIEKDLKIFNADSCLPDDLRKEIRGRVSVPILAYVPVFFYVNVLDKPLLFQICFRATREDRLPGGRTLFNEGDECESMIILNSGSAEYMQLHGTCHVFPPEHLAEMCLWFRWDYQGRLVAKRVVTYIAVESKLFRIAIEKNCSPQMMASLKAYVKLYMEEITVHWASEPTTDLFRLTRNDVREVFAHQLVTNTAHGDTSKTWLGKLGAVFSPSADDADAAE